MDVFDIKLDLDNTDLDVMTQNGDFAVAESTDQHQTLILLAPKADFKEVPSMGVGIESYLNDERPGNLLDSIRKNLAADGMTVESVTIDEKGKLEIDAHYE